MPFPDARCTAASGINDLGVFAGATATRAFGINNRGQIVGFYFEDGRAHGCVATRLRRAPDGASEVPTRT